MANRPISIEFVAEVAQFLKNARNVEVSVDDIADALMAASSDAKDLERKMSRAMKDAEKDVEGLERVIKDIPKATDKMADAAKQDFKKVEDAASEAGQEAGEEFRQNLGEAVSSGDLGDILTDTLGGLVSSLKGPLGLAGAAAAAGAAIAIQQVRADWESMMEALGGAFDGLMAQMQETGRYYQSANEQQQILNDAVRENAEEWGPVRENAELLGMTVQDVGLAILEGGDATDDLKAKLLEARDAGTKVVGEGAQTYIHMNDSAKAANELLKWLQEGGGELADLKDDWATIQSASGISARNTEAMAAAMKNARDYAAGLGGRMPGGGRGVYQDQAV